MKMRQMIFIVLLTSTSIANAQNIATFGGGGSSICELCDATSSLIPNPTGGSFDKEGNYYFVSSISGNRIRKINTLGIITTVAGNGVNGFSGDGDYAVLAKLNSPGAACLDTSENIYISDFQNFRIRKVDAHTGFISTIAGNGTSGYNGDGIPAIDAMIYGGSICSDDEGNIYMSEYNGRRVRKISKTGLISTIAGTGDIGYSGDGGPALTAKLSPNGIAMDISKNLFIADPYANVIRKISPSGIITTIAGNGNPSYIGDGISAISAQFQPAHITVDNSSNIYVADVYNKMVFKITPSGTFYRVAGNGLTGFSGDGGPATAATLDYPSGVATDRCGNLYVTEANNKRIRKVTFNPDCKAVAVKDVEKTNSTSLRLYPNPAHTQLTISTTDPITSLCITNVLGQVVAAAPPALPQEEVTVPVGHLPKGVYLARVNGVYVQRFVKE